MGQTSTCFNKNNSEVTQCSRRRVPCQIFGPWNWLPDYNNTSCCTSRDLIHQLLYQDWSWWLPDAVLQTLFSVKEDHLRRWEKFSSHCLVSQRLSEPSGSPKKTRYPRCILDVRWTERYKSAQRTSWPRKVRIVTILAIVTCVFPGRFPSE